MRCGKVRCGRVAFEFHLFRDLGIGIILRSHRSSEFSDFFRIRHHGPIGTIKSVVAAVEQFESDRQILSMNDFTSSNSPSIVAKIASRIIRGRRGLLRMVEALIMISIESVVVSASITESSISSIAPISSSISSISSISS